MRPLYLMLLLVFLALLWTILIALAGTPEDLQRVNSVVQSALTLVLVATTIHYADRTSDIADTSTQQINEVQRQLAVAQEQLAVAQEQLQLEYTPNLFFSIANWGWYLTNLSKASILIVAQEIDGARLFASDKLIAANERASIDVTRDKGISESLLGNGRHIIRYHFIFGSTAKKIHLLDVEINIKGIGQGQPDVLSQMQSELPSSSSTNP
jgi:hypothetical protein